MAGGPFKPFSAIPATTDRTFNSVHVGKGSNSKEEEGLGFEASLGADSIWRLRFEMPPILPAGTGKLRIIALADAITGAIKLNPKYANVAMGEDPSAATLNAEGTQTITWSTGDNDDYKELKVILDADTPDLVAGEIVVMDLVGETTGWTLAKVVTLHVSIIFE